MRWREKSPNTYFIESEFGYKISFAVIAGVKQYAAWPPRPEGKITVPATYREHEGQTVDLAVWAAIIYTNDFFLARWSCDNHYSLNQGFEGLPEYVAKGDQNPTERPSQQETPKKGILAPPPPPKPSKNSRQGDCRTQEQLINKRGMNEGQAAHVIQARAEKSELQKQVFKACRIMMAAGNSEFSYDNSVIYKMKPKQLKEIIARANKIRKEDKNKNV